MIIVSDIELGGGDVGGASVWSCGAESPPACYGAHLSPGMSSRLVIPVQLMSKVWGWGWGGERDGGGWSEMCGGVHIGVGGCKEGTHWAPDEEHGEGPHDGHIAQQRLQDDPQRPVELGGGDWGGGAPLSAAPPPQCAPRAAPPSPACPSPPPCRRTSSPPRRSAHHPRSCGGGDAAGGGSGHSGTPPEVCACGGGVSRSPDVEVQQDLLLVGTRMCPDPQHTERLWGQQ